MSRRAFLLLPFAPAVRAATPSGQLWQSIGSIYTATLKHPFLTGLTDGSLPRSRFQFYLTQDALYLGAFSRALSILASKAPRQDWAVSLNRDAIESLETEKAMHGEILGSYGITPAAIAAAEMAPSNLAYTNHLLVAVEREPFAEGLAAMLPCYWIYWEVGKHLVSKGSPNKDYQRWINQYSSNAYGKTVERVLAIMDACATAAAMPRIRKLFQISARYEYLFWDMAWREERWQP